MHMAMCGERWRNKWRTESANATANAIIGTRGTENGEFGASSSSFGTGNSADYEFSQTLELHGPKNQWVGNVVFSDNHAETVVSFFPSLILYNRTDSEAPRKDNIYDAEFDDYPLLGDEEASNDQWLILNGVSGIGQYTAGELFYDPLVD
jgi:hypothetical protein